MDEPFIVLNGEKYRVDVTGYVREDAEPFAPIVRDGYPSGATRLDESEVGWRTFHGGAFQATYDEPTPGIPQFVPQPGRDRFASSYNLWTSVPGQVVLGPARNATTVIAAAVTALKTPDASGRIVGLTATDVYYRDSGADSFTSVLTATPTDIIEFNGNYLVAMGNAAAYQYKSALSAGGWTTSNLGATGDLQLADLWAKDFVANLTFGPLWKAVKPNKVYSSVDPTNGSGNWSTAYFVGTSGLNINSLKVFGDRLLVGKPEGLFWVKPDGVPELLFSFRDAINTSNGTLLAQSHTGLIFCNWMHGLIAFNPGSPAQNVTLEEVWRQFAPQVRNTDTETRGRFVAAVAGPTATYFTLWDPSSGGSGNYYLVMWDGQSADRGWHVIHKFGADGSVLGFEQPASGNPRVYAKNASSSPVYFILPNATEEPRNDAGFLFTTSGLMITSEYESPLPEIRKVPFHIDVRAENLTAGTVTILIEYRLDGGSWDTLGTVDTSGSTRLNFPSNLVFRRISLRFTFTGTSSASPRLRAVYLIYVLAEARRGHWTIPIQTGNDPTGRPPSRVLADLEAIEDAFTPIVLADLDDERKTVRLRKITKRVTQGNPLSYMLIADLLETTGTPASVTAGSYAAIERLGDYAALEARTYGGLEVQA